MVRLIIDIKYLKDFKQESQAPRGWSPE